MKRFLTLFLASLFTLTINAQRENKRLFNLDVGLMAHQDMLSKYETSGLNFALICNVSDKISVGISSQFGIDYPMGDAHMYSISKRKILGDSDVSIRTGAFVEYAPIKGNYVPAFGMGIFYGSYDVSGNNYEKFGEDGYYDAFEMRTNSILIAPRISIQRKYIKLGLEYHFSILNWGKIERIGEFKGYKDESKSVLHEDFYAPNGLVLTAGFTIGASYWK